MSHSENTDASPGRAGAELSRRDFVAWSVGGGLAGAGAPAGAAEAVVERAVTITTPDGNADAAFFHPQAGRWPGVLVWADAFGLRPAMRDIGRRLAGEGYAVLVPNPFYRVAKGTLYESAADVDFRAPETMQKLAPLMGSVGAAGAAERDALAYTSFLDAQPEVDTGKRLGTQGYCMGGALVVRSAAAVPARIGAGASFHGGGLVTPQPNSPHLLAPKIRGEMYFGIAASDDAKQPEAKTALRDAFAAARVPAEIEVYPALHGWCVSDMPTDAGTPIYDAAQAERAWAKLLAFYQRALA